MELKLFSNVAPFFIALAILIGLKLKLWRDVKTPNWPQRICAFLTPPTAIFSFLLITIIIGYTTGENEPYAILILLFYLALITPTFAVITLITRARSFLKILMIAVACNLMYLAGQYFTSHNPNRAANLVDVEVLSVLGVFAIIYAVTFWAYMKNWPRRILS